MTQVEALAKYAARASFADLSVQSRKQLPVHILDSLGCCIAALGAGEKEVLALGLQVRDAVVILDERLGRFYAESLKLQVTGTLGILLRARREGQMTRIEPVLDHLKRLGFRPSAPTRESVLRLAGEV